ncbi:MAG TPA: DUF2299 family protein [Gemmatimonadales bacterium]|nr:DUF2299 family protein [Gemmatimonadales bacterium]
MIESAKVRQWLEQDGHTVDVVENAKARWHLATKYPTNDGLQIHLLCPADRDHTLRVILAVQVVDEHQQALRGLKPEAFRTFRFALQRDLLLHGRTEYLLNQTDDERSMKSAATARTLHEDGLSAETFYSALREVHDAMLLIILHVRLASNESL